MKLDIDLGLIGTAEAAEPTILDIDLGEVIKPTKPILSETTKRLFATPETSKDITGDWLQLEPATFRDLRIRKKIRQDINWSDLKDPEVYDEVASAYIQDLKTTFKIPTEKEAALWSWRPGWYQKYGGNIEKIPDEKTVKLKTKTGQIQIKKAKDVMKQRLRDLGKFFLPEAEGAEPELGIDLGLAPKEKSIPEIRAMRPEERRYRRPLTEAEKARAVVDLTYKERGEEVPRGLQLERAITSPEAQAITTAVLFPTYTTLKAIRGAVDREGQFALEDRIIRGIVEPETVKSFYEYIPGAERLPRWAKITADLVETIGALGLMGLGKAALKQELLKRDISRKLNAAADQFANENLNRLLPTTEKAQPAIVAAVKADLKNEYIKRAYQRITALDTQEITTQKAILAKGGIEAEYITRPSVLQQYAQRRTLLGLLKDELTAVGEAGSIPAKKVAIGDTVRWAGETGRVLRLEPGRAILEIAGREIAAPLSELMKPKIEPEIKPLQPITKPEKIKFQPDQEVQDITGARGIVKSSKIDPDTGIRFYQVEFAEGIAQMSEGVIKPIEAPPVEEIKPISRELEEMKKRAIRFQEAGKTAENFEKFISKTRPEATKKILRSGFSSLQDFYAQATKGIKPAIASEIPPPEAPAPPVEEIAPQLTPDDLTPDILSKLVVSERDLAIKRVIEGKSIEQTAQELGEDPKDVIKEEQWLTQSVQAIREAQAMSDEELRAGMEKEGDIAFRESQTQLKSYLTGKLKPELKIKGEYTDLKLLNWLFAKEGGFTPDELVDELQGMGYNVETGDQVRELIKEYFIEDIQKKAATAVAKYDKKIANVTKRDIAKTRKTKIIEELRMQKLRVIAEQLTKIAEIAPHLITPKQQAYIHILKDKRLISESQYKRLLQITTGKRTTAYRTPTGKIRKRFVTKKEAARMIKAEKESMKRRGRLILPKRGVEVAPEEIATEVKNQRILEEIKKAKLPFNDVETLVRLKGIRFEFMTQTQQDELIKTLQELQANPDEGDRMRQLMQGTPTFTDLRIEKEYKNLTSREAHIRKGGFDKGRKRIAEGKTTASPMRQQLYLNIKQRLQDVRFTMGELETKSGLPFYSQHYHDISRLHDLKMKEKDKIYTMLYKNLKELLNLDEQRHVSNYFQAIYEGKKPPTLIPVEQTYAKNLQTVMQYFKPYIREYRYYQWLESKLAGENQGLGNTDMLDVTQDTLEEGLVIYQTGGDLALKDWLKTQTFGTIKKGYIPRAILGGKAKFPHYNIGMFTRRMLKPRQAKVDLSNIPLQHRVTTYINNVLNLKYLERAIGNLDTQIDALSQGGHISRETIDSIQGWIDRAKGYPRENDALNKVLMGLQRQFFRTITVNPRLWFRNMFQRKVTPPFKKPLLAPRTMLVHWDKLPQTAKDYFMNHINQFEEMKTQYLYFLEEQRTRLPGLRQYTGLAEKAGSIYPLTDMWNRQAAYTQTYFYIQPYITQYKQETISLVKLKANTGYNLMKPYEQKYFLKLLDQNPEGAGLFAAKWNSDNSQWMYKLTERSLDEISTKNSALYNLFVWPKGLVQLVSHLSSKTAAKDVPFRERRDSFIALIGLIFSFELARRLINKIYGRAKETGYEGYNIVRAMFWNLGGAMITEVNDLIRFSSDVIYAYTYGDEKQKKQTKARFLKNLDTASYILLPFWNPILGAIEALTDYEYISPLYNAFYKHAKAIPRTTIEKMQHFFFRSTRRPEQKGKGGFGLGLDLDLGIDLGLDIDLGL